MRFLSPLRYPGGKRSIARFVQLVVEKNGLYGGDYVEAYAGGAGVALSLLHEKCIERIHLNDLNPQVFAFWNCVLNNTEDLCRLIHDTPVTMENWQLQQQIYHSPETHTTIEVGFAFFFLNRTNRSGILNGGVIGGLDQQGNYKIDARYNKSGLVERIQKVAEHREAIQIYNKTASQFIIEDVANLPRKTLVYLDPPYYVKGGDLYDNSYVHENHVAIRKLIGRRLRTKKWIVSYDNVSQIRELYQYYRSIEYSLRYSANERIAGSEIMFFSTNMLIPTVDSPAYLTRPELAQQLDKDALIQTHMGLT